MGRSLDRDTAENTRERVFTLFAGGGNRVREGEGGRWRFTEESERDALALDLNLIIVQARWIRK